MNSKSSLAAVYSVYMHTGLCLACGIEKWHNTEGYFSPVGPAPHCHKASLYDGTLSVFFSLLYLVLLPPHFFMIC